MITAQQIRAGRALLNWSQRDLAKKSGVSLNAINNFEREIVAPRQDTLVKLRKTLEQAGLEFIGDTGVDRAHQKLSVLQHQGQGFMKVLVDDVIATLRAGADTFFVYGVDFARIPYRECQELGRIMEFQQKSKLELQERVILPYGVFSFPGNEPIYRWVSREMLGEVAYVIYGDTLALLMDGPPQNLIILRNRSIAKTFRDEFELHWKSGKAPTPEQLRRGWEEFHAAFAAAEREAA